MTEMLARILALIEAGEVWLRPIDQIQTCGPMIL
jgi:hypothetical protein